MPEDLEGGRKDLRPGNEKIRIHQVRQEISHSLVQF
jgi:hypothetical protein